MRQYRRPLILLIVAVVLPAVIFGSLLFYLESRRQQHDIKVAAVGRVTEVMLRVDAQVQGLQSALEVLANSTILARNDLATFEPRARRIIQRFPAWISLVLWDGGSGRVIWSTGRSPDAPLWFQNPPLIKPLGIGGVQLLGEPKKAYVVLSTAALGGDRHQVLGAVVDPITFQNLLAASLPREVVAGIVDRNGLFVARTLAYSSRVGTPATKSVRDIVAGRDKAGVFAATTWEGFNSYTAFYRSPLSGWSTHIAFASALIDQPGIWSLAVAGIAGVLGTALAVLLVILVLREMAERRRADEAMYRAQKMEAVGQLSGGIAHDFNNLLTIIIGSADLIKRRAGDATQVIRHADAVIAAARRGAKLTSQLLAFSRAQNFEFKPVDLRALFQQNEGLLQSALGAQHELKIQIPAPGSVVLTDAVQLELALLNLAVNARDAMPHGGKVTMATRSLSLKSEGGLASGEYIEIAVSDNGVGMSEEVRARALEPFFTTKPSGSGTGLGLSQVFAIVGRSAGRVDIESAVGTGTTIRLLLPRAPASANELADAPVTSMGLVPQMSVEPV